MIIVLEQDESKIKREMRWSKLKFSFAESKRLVNKC